MPDTQDTGDIERRLHDCVKHTFGVETVKPTDRLVEDLSGDSLDAIELVLHVEEEFAIEIPDDQADTIKTVGDAVALVTRITGKGD